MLSAKAIKSMYFIVAGFNLTTSDAVKHVLRITIKWCQDMLHVLAETIKL